MSAGELEQCWECRQCGGHYGTFWAALHWHSARWGTWHRWPKGRHK